MKYIEIYKGAESDMPPVNVTERISDSAPFLIRSVSVCSWLFGDKYDLIAGEHSRFQLQGDLFGLLWNFIVDGTLGFFAG